MYYSEHILGFLCEVFLLRLYFCIFYEGWNEKYFPQHLKALEAPHQFYYSSLPFRPFEGLVNTLLPQISWDIKPNNQGKDQASIWMVSHFVEEQFETM